LNLIPKRERRDTKQRNNNNYYENHNSTQSFIPLNTSLKVNKKFLDAFHQVALIALLFSVLNLFSNADRC
jgi:hypothetical protein